MISLHIEARDAMEFMNELGSIARMYHGAATFEAAREAAAVAPSSVAEPAPAESPKPRGGRKPKVQEQTTAASPDVSVGTEGPETVPAESSNGDPAPLDGEVLPPEIDEAKLREVLTKVSNTDGLGPEKAFELLTGAGFQKVSAVTAEKRREIVEAGQALLRSVG